MVVALVAVLVLASPAGASGQEPEAAAQGAVPAGATEYRAVLNRYCTTCHNDRLRTAGLTLESIDVTHVAAGAEVWEKVIRKLRAREMPPPRRPRPDDETYGHFVDWIEAELEQASLADPNPGTETIHRLNRTEYTNAIRDLLALEIDGRELLPADDQSYGFDNIADVLSLSTSLLERYMLAAGKIAQLAIGDPSIRTTTAVYTTSPVLMQHHRMSELQPFGTRGGFATRHYFPVDGEYEFRITLERTHGDAIKGLQNRNRLEIRLDRARVAEFLVGGDGQREAWNGVFNSPRTSGRGQGSARAHTGDGRDARDCLLFRAQRSARRRGARARERGRDVSLRRGPRRAGRGLDRRDRRAVQSAGAAGGHRLAEPDAHLHLHAGRSRGRAGLRDGDPGRHRAARLPAPCRRRRRRGAAGVLRGRTHGRRRLRVGHRVRAPRHPGRSRVPLPRGSRSARDRAGSAVPDSDVELASRLSFFLWSSIPDDELLDLAEAGRLRDPGCCGRRCDGC